VGTAGLTGGIAINACKLPLSCYRKLAMKNHFILTCYCNGTTIKLQMNGRSHKKKRHSYDCVKFQELNKEVNKMIQTSSFNTLHTIGMGFYGYMLSMPTQISPLLGTAIGVISSIFIQITSHFTPEETKLNKYLFLAQKITVTSFISSFGISIINELPNITFYPTNETWELTQNAIMLAGLVLASEIFTQMRMKKRSDSPHAQQSI
jgi:hypothetical protein